jgi:hypothetical protein
MVLGRVSFVESNGQFIAAAGVNVPKNFIENGNSITISNHTDEDRLRRNNVQYLSFASINQAYFNKNGKP